MGLRSSINTVSRAAAQDLVEIGTQMGILSHPHLKELGWDNDKTHDATARIPESLLITLWQTFEKHEKAQGLGLRIGQTINPDAKGLLASWISQTKNLREALTIFRDNILLMNPSENWELIETNKTATLTFHLKEERGYPAIAIERSMSAMVTWARALSGKSFEIEEARFRFSAPTYRAQFSAIFGDNVAFDCPQNQLILDKKVLELAIISDNPFLKELIGAKAEQNLAEIQNNLTMKDKTMGLLKEAMKSNHTLTIKDVSDALAVSRQTLYRRLKEEGTDFQSLQEQVRKTEASKLLTSGHSITAISLSLGYKDASSFYKAFKRWYGCSPKAYLEAH